MFVKRVEEWDLGTDNPFPPHLLYCSTLSVLVKDHLAIGSWTEDVLTLCPFLLWLCWVLLLVVVFELGCYYVTQSALELTQ